MSPTVPYTNSEYVFFQLRLGRNSEALSSGFVGVSPSYKTNISGLHAVVQMLIFVQKQSFASYLHVKQNQRYHIPDIRARYEIMVLIVNAHANAISWARCLNCDPSLHLQSYFAICLPMRYVLKSNVLAHIK